MRRRNDLFLTTLLLALLPGPAAMAAQNADVDNRTLLLAGGGYGPGVLDTFARLAGGSTATVYYIPSASSGIRLPSGFTWLPPEEAQSAGNTREFERELAALFQVGRVRVLHSRDRRDWDGPLADSLSQARVVWLSEGNAGRLASLLLGTRAERELGRLLASGGLVGGNSAGAIIAGSFIVRGRPDKPILMARGHDQGFGWLPNIVINPHLTEAKRENELINVLDAHPELLGIGLDENVALLVRGQAFEVLGEGRVAIYDDRLHDGRWYYDLAPGSRFDLRTRSIVRP